MRHVTVSKDARKYLAAKCLEIKEKIDWLYRKGYDDAAIERYEHELRMLREIAKAIGNPDI